MAENKVTFGLKNVYYSVLTFGTNGAPSYATPVALPGAVNLNLDAQGDRSVFYADDVEYFVINNNSGYSGTLEVARLTDDFRKTILGEILDNKGVLVENKNAAAVHFALLFEFDGDITPTKHVVYNLTASRPSVASTTKTETTEPQTESLDISAGSIFVSALNANIVKARTAENTDASTYSGWNSAVYIPAGLPS